MPNECQISFVCKVVGVYYHQQEQYLLICGGKFHPCQNHFLNFYFDTPSKSKQPQERIKYSEDLSSCSYNDDCGRSPKNSSKEASVERRSKPSNNWNQQQQATLVFRIIVITVLCSLGGRMWSRAPGSFSSFVIAFLVCVDCFCGGVFYDSRLPPGDIYDAHRWH
jgi:hypothetical protein